ncbi:MAG: hypothetical protein M3404_01660 [Actinomycetota bacterium]|nr:hypothetical protein [Actinomycetota bacterium]
MGVLTDAMRASSPRSFPRDWDQAARPGMYGWWGDEEARAILGEAIGAELPPLLYVGQSGATKWPSGKRSSATLASRVDRQHIRGNARSSTFRLTISSLLLSRFGLVAVTGGKLDKASNERVSEWIADHLRVVIAPYDDRDNLGVVEAEVVTQLDPPLNLGHCLPSDARDRLTELRRSLSR